MDNPKLAKGYGFLGLTEATWIQPMNEVPSNFTPRACRALGLATNEARRLNHDCVDTEHLLLGITLLNKGVAATIIKGMDVDLKSLRLAIENQGKAHPAPLKDNSRLPYSSGVIKVLQLATQEAEAMKHTYVGTEHLLLCLLLEGNGKAAEVVKNLGFRVGSLRQNIHRVLGPPNLNTIKEYGIKLGGGVTEEVLNRITAEFLEEHLSVPKPKKSK